MMRPRIVQAALIASLLCAAPLFAQDAVQTDADAPEVRLPDMEAEVGSVAPKDVQAPLPPLKPLPLPAASPPLPPDLETAIPESAYKTEATLDTAPRASLGETFSEASVGAGLWDAVSASLSIYRPGSDPSFSMTFAHDMADGFAYHRKGQGFSARRTALNGRVRGAFEELGSWTFSAGFLDEATGLQKQSVDFYGVSHRYLDVRGDYKRPLGEILGGALDARAAAAVSSASLAFEIAQSSPTGILNADELSATPSVGIAWRRDPYGVFLDAEYDFRGLLGLHDGDAPEERSSQRVRADLSAQWDVSSSLGLKAAVGFASSSSFSGLVPFSLSADAGLGDFASLSVDGGLRTTVGRFADEWRKNPYLDIGELPPDDARWFAESKIDLFLLPGLIARVGADWASSLSGGGRLTPFWVDDSRALYSYAIEDYRTFLSRLGVRWVRGGATVSATWEADWLDDPVVGEEQRLKAEIEYRERNEAYGGAFSASFGFSGSSIGESPILDASGFVRLTPEIRFIAEFRDAAAAFLENGRSFWDPYLSGGFQASARILISL